MTEEIEKKNAAPIYVVMVETKSHSKPRFSLTPISFLLKFHMKPKFKSWRQRKLWDNQVKSHVSWIDKTNEGICFYDLPMSEKKFFHGEKKKCFVDFLKNDEFLQIDKHLFDQHQSWKLYRKKGRTFKWAGKAYQTMGNMEPPSSFLDIAECWSCEEQKALCGIAVPNRGSTIQKRLTVVSYMCSWIIYEQICHD